MNLRTISAALCLLLSACQSSTPPITIDNAWSPATPPTATVAAAYLQITSHQPDELLSASTPVADRVEMHITIEDGGMMRMRPLATLAIPAGVTVSFEPGGHHFMLIGLKAPLAEGTTFPLILRFRNAGEVAVQTIVRPAV